MRLAFIRKKFSAHGGAEQYLRTLLDELRKGGHEIHVLANEWSESDGVTFHRVPVLDLGSFLSTASFNRNVRRTLREKVNPDCTISFERTTCQDIYRAGDGCHAEWLRLRSAAEPKWKRITFRINPLHRTLLSLERRIFRDTPLVIANSNMVKEQIVRRYGRPAESILTIYNGVDIERFTPAKREVFRDRIRRDLALTKDDKVLLFVGSGFERKGLALLLRSQAVLNQGRPASGKFSLLVIGRGNIRKFEKLALDLGVRESVFFLGPQQNMETFYTSADIFVLPTLYDPFSNATLEAMASGLPVITTCGNGASEIIREAVEGFVLDDPLDQRALAERIVQTCTDPVAMGKKARLRAQEYSIGKAADDFMRALTSPTGYGKLSG